jgi:hypothetical protein
LADTPSAELLPNQYIVIFKADAFPNGLSVSGETPRQTESD